MNDSDLSAKIARLQEDVRLTGNHRYQRYDPILDRWDYLASVSSVLRVLDKPALLGWAARLGAETGDPHAHEKVRNDAAASGTDLHSAIERECRLMLGSGAGPAAELADDKALALLRWKKWASDVGFRPVAVEFIVAHTLGYAGRVDFLAWVEGVLRLGDWKTGKDSKIYPEHHLQNAALRVAFAEFLGCEEPPGLIVGVPRDGDLISAKPGTEDLALSMAAFKGLMAARVWQSAIKKEIEAA